MNEVIFTWSKQGVDESLNAIILWSTFLGCKAHLVHFDSRPPPTSFFNVFFPMETNQMPIIYDDLVYLLHGLHYLKIYDWVLKCLLMFFYN